MVEELGKPAVAIFNKDFVVVGKQIASRQMPGLRIVGEHVPPENTVAERAGAGVDSAVIDELIAALTRPLNEEESSPKRPSAVRASKIVFKGTLGEINRFFYEQGWTDGLPVMPPTEEAVEEMLTGTDLTPDHLVAKLEPGLGKATVEKIAINAVMAGCLPSYMPVLIAGVQALADPIRQSALNMVSTASFTPFWIINGPIRNQLGINKSTGAFSPGVMANAAIGRAMWLIAQNTAQARKGIEDMGQLGNPERYTMVIAEDEERSPWVPLHVERGLNREDSAVTLHLPNQFMQFLSLGTNARGILTAVIANASPGVAEQICLLFTPTHAKMLAEEGWTKEEIKVYVSRFALRPAYQHPFSIIPGFSPKATTPVDERDLRPLYPNPDNILVLVGGGPDGAFIGLFPGGFLGEGRFVTKKVELPRNWDELVNKYKGIVPKYLSMMK